MSHGAEGLDIINYSLALKREIWMESRLEKPIIREERAETSAAALTKFAFSIARSNKWETQERVFEEEGLIFNLSLKREGFRKYKDFFWAFENDEKTDIFSMKANLKSDFSKTQTCFQKPKSGKNDTSVLKFLVEVPFENGAFRVRHYCFQPTLE